MATQPIKQIAITEDSDRGAWIYAVTENGELWRFGDFDKSYGGGGVWHRLPGIPAKERAFRPADMSNL